MGSATPYCVSRFNPTRRRTTEVKIGNITIGGKHSVKVQSMTTTDTLDIKGTVNQTIELAEAGCEIGESPPLMYEQLRHLVKLKRK